MRFAGIIAEYDPFHNGHAWQLAQARARALGIPCQGGLTMLIYQAVFALEYFAGVRIDAKEMEQHVIEACGLGGEA